MIYDQQSGVSRPTRTAGYDSKVTDSLYGVSRSSEPPTRDIGHLDISSPSGSSGVNDRLYGVARPTGSKPYDSAAGSGGRASSGGKSQASGPIGRTKSGSSLNSGASSGSDFGQQLKARGAKYVFMSEKLHNF